ncbi:hypothetical protein HBB16_09385 [Pseudonocardia sp. MCCB 268]|nr:hypothetical protein [Pseudonocardia cytotoxica]
MSDEDEPASPRRRPGPDGADPPACELIQESPDRHRASRAGHSPPPAAPTPGRRSRRRPCSPERLHETRRASWIAAFAFSTSSATPPPELDEPDSLPELPDPASPTKPRTRATRARSRTRPRAAGVRRAARPGSSDSNLARAGLDGLESLEPV